MAMDHDMVLEDRRMDDALRTRLASYVEQETDYWSFRGRAVREQTHAYVQYPAMMVPQMQGRLIHILRELIPSIRSVCDPFMGAGTVMTEAMLQGLDFAGQDINPLSVLVCQAKSGPFDQQTLRGKVEGLDARIECDARAGIEADFPGLGKWFQGEVSSALSRIRRSVREERDIWARRFFWIALAETVRLTSNSRTSTFKLHIRSEAEIGTRKLDPIAIFRATVARNMDRLATHQAALGEQGFLHRDHRYRGRIAIALADSMVGSRIAASPVEHDLLVTSPPYGDNETTVPYGQYSYLPLQWIDLADIDASLDGACLATTKAIDNLSLGGKRPRDGLDRGRMEQISPSFKETIALLDGEPADRRRRVTAFYADLSGSLDVVLAALKPGGHMVWTVGNRRVAGLPIPMDMILGEFLTARGATVISSFQRAIPSKRMAIKNKIAATMRAETILVARAGGA